MMNLSVISIIDYPSCPAANIAAIVTRVCQWYEARDTQPTQTRESHEFLDLKVPEDGKAKVTLMSIRW